MKLSCALVLALTNLVIATPFSFSLKGSGSSSKVDPSAAPYGTFGLVQPVGSSTGFSGTFSKSSSANFAASSASESSGSFSYNAAQGTPSVAYNSVPSVGVTGQVVGQNVAVTPQAFTTAVPVIHNTGSSEDAGAQAYYFSKEVKNVSPFVNAPSTVQPENQPDINIGYNAHAFVSQDKTKPNAFASAGSTLDSGISGSLSSQYVSSNQVNTNTASNLPAGQQPGIYLGSTSHVSETQGNLKPNTLVSGSPAYTTVSDTSYNQEVHGVQGVQVNTDTASQLQHKLVATEQKPAVYLGSNTQTPVSQDTSNSNVIVSNVASKESEKNKEWSTVYGVSSSVVNSGAVVSPLTTLTQTTPYVEKKPVYSSGFGGPPGVLSPYDKPVSGFDIASNFNTQQNAQLSELVSPTPQEFSYTPVNNPKPSYAFQQQQTLTAQPEQSFASGANYFTSNVETIYKPEIKPTSQKENVPVSVNTNEKPLSELKPSNYVQTSVVQDVYQKPEVESSKKPEIVVEYPSQTIKPGYQISVQAYPSKQTVPESELVEKVEHSKKPLYTGGFGAPAGILEPIKPTVNEVHNFAFTTVKPQQYEESKPTVGYTPTVTNVNKYSSISEEVNPTEKPYIETASYQPLNVGSSPASYVTFKPTGSVSYSEQDTSSFVSSTAAPVGAIGQKGEGQILSKPYDTIPVKPTFSTWGLNPTQTSVLLVQKPEIVEPVKPAVQVSSPSEPIFSKTPETFTTAQPATYQFEGKNPTSVPVKYEPSNVLVVKDEIKPYSEVVSTNQYESSQSGAVVNQVEVEKQSYQVYPTGSPSISSTVASSYKPEQTFVPFDQTKPTGTVVITSQKEGSTVSDVKVPNLPEKNISPVFGEVKPTVSQNSAVYSTPGFVSVSQQPTNKPSFEGSSEKVPAIAFSGNPLTIPHANKPSTLYTEQKDTQKLNSEVITTSTPTKVPVLVSNTYSGKIESQFPKKPTVTNPDKPSYSSSFGTLTGSTGYISSSYGQESTIVTGSKDKVPQINFGTTVKPFVKPELSTLSQQTVVQTDAVSQSAQKQTGSGFVQNKPSVVASEGQKPITQVFTTNSAVPSGSKLQYQLPTIQPTVQKNPWYTNSFGTFSTAKPYNNFYPGFTSSVTTYGQDLSQDKTKQTTQITSPGQYTSFSSGQYQPYTTGQYKPYNWGFNGYSSYPKFSNVYPTGGTFVSTYAPTTFKPFVTSSPFEKSKTSSIFPVTDNKESTYVSAFGSPLSVTTAKPSSPIQTQTSYKPVQELEKVNTVVAPPKYEAPVSKPIETQPKKSSLFSVNSGSLGSSSFGQSSFSTVKPTANLLTSSAQSVVNLETVKPSTQLPSKVVEVNENNESGLTDKVSKLPESSFTSVPVSHVTPLIQNKPSSDVNVASVVSKPSSSFAPQIKVDEKVQPSQTLKPEWSSELNHKESSVGVGVTPNGLKPTEQPYLGTTSYFINKEVKPTQVSAIKPSSTFTLNTVSASKGDENIQYNQTPKPEWSSPVSNQKEPSVAVSVGETSESIKPIPFHGTNSYYFNKEVTPTEISATKPSSYGTFTVNTSSQNKVDEKVQFIQTSKPLWSSNQKVESDSSKPEWSSPVSNQKEPSVAVSVGETSESIKPIPFHGTNSYYFNKEVTPTEISATKPSSYGTFTVNTSSQNKVDEKVQYIQTSKPVWSSNQKASSDSSKPTVQPSLGTSFYSINKVATPIQVDDKKPLTSGTFSTGLVTGNTNVGSIPSVASSASESNSGIHVSSVEKWSATAIPVVTQKPNSFEQSSGSEVTPKPLAATDNVQYISQVTTGKPVFSKPIAQISAVEKKPALVVSYKEKDTKEGSVVSTVVKPTVPSEYATNVKVTSKYTDVPAKVPTTFVQSTQIPTQTNQQTWGFHSNAGASQSTQTSYVGGFGGPSGILKPNDNQQQYVHTQYKPSYNNQYAWANNQNPHTGYNYNTGSYFGRFGAPAGAWSTNEYVKPSGFGYLHNANKWQKNANQHAVFQSQASAGTPSNVVNPTTAGFVSGHHHIQNPFSGTTGTGLTSNDFKLTGQFSGTKALGTPQGTPSTSVGYKTVGPTVFASLL